MKNICKYIFLLFCSTMIISCEIDDAPRPDCSFEGVIIDQETGEPFEAKIASTDGRVRMYEDNPNYPSPTSQYVPIMQNGKFSRRMLPETSYIIDTYRCPHLLVSDPVKVSLSGGTVPRITLYCIPFLRLKLRVENDNMILVISKSDKIQHMGDIKNVQFAYGSTSNLNESSTSLDMNTLISATITGGTTQENVLNKEIIMPISTFEGIKSGKYYFRAMARIEGIEEVDERNYSNTVYAEYAGM